MSNENNLIEEEVLTSKINNPNMDCLGDKLEGENLNYKIIKRRLRKKTFKRIGEREYFLNLKNALKIALDENDQLRKTLLQVKRNIKLKERDLAILEEFIRVNFSDDFLSKHQESSTILSDSERN